MKPTRAERAGFLWFQKPQPATVAHPGYGTSTVTHLEPPKLSGWFIKNQP